MSVNLEDIEANVKAALEEEFEPEVETDVETETETETETEVEVEVETEIEEPEFTEKELEAKDLGWNPEGQDRDGNTLSAEEFLARKPLFNKIKNQNQRLEEQNGKLTALEKQMEKLAKDNQSIAAAKIKEREAFLEQLKQAKEVALDELKVDEVRHIDNQMEKVREELSKPAEEPAKEQYVSPDYNDFVAENEWAKDETSAMYDSAERIAIRYKQVHPEATDKELYGHIHKEIRDAYPHKFETKPVRRQGVGNNNQRQPIKPVVTKKTLSDLPEDQRAIAQEVMESTGQTIDEYLEVYKF